MLRVKMCGFKDSETLRYACENGADAIGLNFCASSRRYVNIDTARALARCIPSFVSTVALFVNADASSVKEVVAEVPVSTLPFGSGSPKVVVGLGGSPLEDVEPAIDDLKSPVS